MTTSLPKGPPVLSKIPVVAYIVGAVIFLAILAGFVVLLSEGKNTDPFVNFLTQQLVPAIAGIVGLINFAKLRQVQQQTNGTTTALTDLVTTQSNQLATSVPAAAVVVPAVVPPTAAPPALRPPETPHA